MENKFKIFVIVAIAVLGLAIAGSTFFILRALNNTNTAPSEEVKEEVVELTEVAIGEAVMTNIASEGNVQHFAKIQVKIGVDASDEEEFTEFSEKLASKTASIRNELISTIGEQTYTMLSDTNTGKEKLADEIISRLNQLLDTDLIQAVYYEEYFVQ